MRESEKEEDTVNWKINHRESNEIDCNQFYIKNIISDEWKLQTICQSEIILWIKIYLKNWKLLLVYQDNFSKEY